MKNNNLSLSSIVDPIKTFFSRFHVIIYSVIVIGGLAVAVFFLSLTIAGAETSQDNTITSAGFDQSTIDEINKLRKSDEQPATIAYPSGRVNPFLE